MIDSQNYSARASFIIVVLYIIGVESREFGRRDPSRWSRGTLHPQKLALTSPTSGGRSVGIVRSRTQATEYFFYYLMLLDIVLHICKWHVTKLTAYFIPQLVCCYYYIGPSQMSLCLMHDLPSSAQTLGSWVRIPLEARMFLCVSSGFLFPYV
jgi:hypothetical protein